MTSNALRSLLSPIQVKITEYNTDVARRQALCYACDNYRRKGLFNLPYDACGKCGCPIESKTRVPGAKCPVNKW